MNREIIELREMVTKLVPLIAGKGLKVTQRGTGAYVKADPKTMKPVLVNIPNIPDTASPDFIRAIQGFIDHEVAHVLITDFTIASQLASMPGDRRSRLHELHNIVEDTMIEREMAKLFPGSRRNISDLRRHFLAKVTKPVVDNAKDDKEKFSYLIVAAMRALAGHEEFQEYMDKDGHWANSFVKELVDRLSSKTKLNLPKLTSTQQTLDVAREMEAILYPPPPVVSSVDPSEGLPGQSVIITGDNFVNVKGARFGTSVCKRIRVIDSKTIEAIVPAGKEGPVRVEVQSVTGIGGLDVAFTYLEQPAAPSSSDDQDSDSTDQPDKEAGEGDGDGARDHKDAEDEAEGKTGKGKKEKEDAVEKDTDADADQSPDGNAPDSDQADAETDDGDAENDDEDTAGQTDEEDPADGSAGDGDDDDEESDDGAGNGDSAGAGDEKGSEEDESDDSKDSAPQRGSAGEKADGSSDTGRASSVVEDSGDHSADPGYESEDDDQDGGGGVDNGMGKSLFEFADDDFAKKDLASAIAILLTKDAIDAANGSDYNVYTREFDRIENAPSPDTAADWVAKMEDQTRAMTGRMQKDIERMMASQSHVIKIPGYRSGRLHAPSLHRLLAGDNRVFNRRQEHQSKDTAVTLLVDNSGSMSGVKCETAMISAYALSQTLERVSIANEVIGFTTGGYHNASRAVQDAMYKEIRTSGVTYHRYTPIVMPIYKSFDERFNAEIKRRFAAMTYGQNGMIANVDGESLEYAAIRLLKRREKRKVILVLSDGAPAGGANCGPHLKLTVQKMAKIGIDCIGIGIMDDSVKHYYDRFTVLNDVAELPGKVMTELKALLT